MGGPFELVFWIKSKTFSESSHLNFPKCLQNKNILTQGYILHFIFVRRFPNETPTLGDCWLSNDDTLGHLLFWGMMREIRGRGGEADKGDTRTGMSPQKLEFILSFGSKAEDNEVAAQ